MDPNTPLWALSVAAAVGAITAAGYQVVKLWYHIQDQRLVFRKKVHEADAAERDLNERSDSAEAWRVVDRLTKELESVGPRMTRLETAARSATQRATKCESDHEGTKRILRMVIAWGKPLGMQLPPDVEEELKPGSSTHKVLEPPSEGPSDD